MPETIHFSLRNNQIGTDVTVNVQDDRVGRLVLEAFPLNVGDSVDVEVAADSWGKGSATWAFWSADGSVNSNKHQPDIRDGDNFILG